MHMQLIIIKVTCRVRVTYKGSSDLFKRVKSPFFLSFLNKFLKHAFNIVFNSIKYMIVYNSIKLFFVQKNDTQISGFALTKKAPSP